jgi:hypothetical protein
MAGFRWKMELLRDNVPWNTARLLFVPVGGEKWSFIAGKIIDKWENHQKLVGGFSPPL